MPDNTTPRSSVHISTEDVRHFVLDRSVEDNILDVDLSFSEDEIAKAMVRCAQEYNSIPPIGVSAVFGNRLPAATTMFLYGTAKHLYLAAMQKAMRNDVEYTAGAVTTSLYKDRINHYKTLVKTMDEEFKQQALSYKKAVNIARAYGPIG
jgi:hypothetical protein